MLKQDRVLSDIEAIYLPPSPGRFEVDGLAEGRRKNDLQGFEIASPLHDKYQRECAQKIRLAHHKEQLELAKRLLKTRRKKNSVAAKFYRSVNHALAQSSLKGKEKELVALFLLTGVVFQIGIIINNLLF